MGLNQPQFAELTGLGEKRLAAWEAGINMPDKPSEIAIQLEERTGVDRLWWIGWAEGSELPEPSPSEPPKSGDDLPTCGYAPRNLRIIEGGGLITPDRAMVWAIP